MLTFEPSRKPSFNRGGHDGVSSRWSSSFSSVLGADMKCSAAHHTRLGHLYLYSSQHVAIVLVKFVGIVELACLSWAIRWRVRKVVVASRPALKIRVKHNTLVKIQLTSKQLHRKTCQTLIL